MKKKITLFLGMVMASICLFLAAAGGMGAKAAQKKPALMQKKITSYVGGGGYIAVQNPNIKAKYTCVVNKKNMLEAQCGGISEFTPQYLGFTINPLKTGTVKVTVKETYKGKVKKIGTCTVEIKAMGDYVGLLGSNYSASKGSSFSLSAVGIIPYSSPSGKLRYQSSNPSVASITKNGVVTAKNTGTTTITATQGKDSKSCSLTVVDRAVKKEHIDFAKAVNALAKKKITASNLTFSYNQYVELWNKWMKYGYSATVYEKGNGTYNHGTTADGKDASYYVQIPLLHSLEEARGRLESFLKGKTTINSEGVSLDVVQISKLNAGTGKMNVKLSKKITKYDVIAQELHAGGNRKKYTSSLKTNIPFVVSDKQGIKYRYIGGVKAGQKSVTAKLMLYSYGPNQKIKKGTTYYFAVANQKKWQFQTNSIKAQ